MMMMTTQRLNRIARRFAEALASYAVPSRRVRPDVGAVQVDRVRLEAESGEALALLFTLDVAEQSGTQVCVRLDEYLDDPEGCLQRVQAQLFRLTRALRGARA